MGAGSLTTNYEFGGSAGRANAQGISITHSRSTAQDIQQAKTHQAQISNGYNQQHSGEIRHMFGGNASVGTLSKKMSDVTRNRNIQIAKSSGLSEDQLVGVAEVKRLEAAGKTEEAKQMQASLGLSAKQVGAGADALRRIANSSGLTGSKANSADSQDSHRDGLSSTRSGSDMTSRADNVGAGSNQSKLSSAGWAAAGALAIASVSAGSISDNYSFITGTKDTTTQQLTMPQAFDPAEYGSGGYAGEVAPHNVGDLAGERQAAENKILGRRAGADSRASAFEGRSNTLFGDYSKPIANPDSKPRSSYDMWAPGSAGNPKNPSQSLAGNVDHGMQERAQSREKIKKATETASDKTRYSADYNANRNTPFFTRATTNYKNGHINLDPKYYPGKDTLKALTQDGKAAAKSVVSTLGNGQTW
jgi:hypothetical protein